MSQALNSRTRRILLWTAACLLLAVCILAIVVGSKLKDKSVKDRVAEALSVKLKAEVTLNSLQVHFFPSVRIVGEGLTIRRLVDPANHPPIIVAQSFTVHPGLRNILRGRAEQVEMVGMRLTVPRRMGGGPEDTPSQGEAEPNGSTEAKPAGPAIINRLTAKNAELVYVSKRPDGPLRVFQIHEVELLDVSFDNPMVFAAHLTNPLPRGQVRSKGHFGPFDPDEPGQSPIEGSYDFAEADFGTLRGLSGTVTSKGIFSGILDEVQVDGTTDSDNFQIDKGGHPIALVTQFRAVVDATSGDLQISHLDGRLAESAFTATGSIARTETADGYRGRYVALDIEFAAGRIEDLLGFMHEAARPLMHGDVTLKGKVLLPTGKGRALDRLDVTGTLGLDDGQFSSRAMQGKLLEMSRRAQGLKKDEAPTSAVVDLKGTFRILKGQARFRTLHFRTDGAQISLVGNYGLRDTGLDFTGTVRFEASMSKVVGGVKGFFLKALDPLFRKQGAGSVVPIRMTGTLREPKTSVQMGKIFKN
jgi:AsmA-like C-terminal region